MSSLLRIDVSPRGALSITRKMGDAFVAEWQKKHPSRPVVHRDLAETLSPLQICPG